MCCLKLSKNVFPFTLTFILGLFIVGVVSYFIAPSKVVSPQYNEVEVYSSVEEKSSCDTHRNDTYRSRSKRIVRPSLEETIIINEEVKKSSE